MLSFSESLKQEGEQRRTKMQFTHEDGTTYVHDFAATSSSSSALEAESAEQAKGQSNVGGGAAGIPEGGHADGGVEPKQVNGVADAELIQPVPPKLLQAHGIEKAAAAPNATKAEQNASTAEPEGTASEPPPTPAAEPSSSAAKEQAAANQAAAAKTYLGATLGELPATIGRGSRKLRFYSWWYEDAENADLTFRVNTNQSVGGGLAKRNVTIDYDLGSQTFTMQSTVADQELVVPGLLPVLRSTGTTADVWDLHVGATLYVLSKQVTLLKADGDTSAWLEKHAK